MLTDRLKRIRHIIVVTTYGGRRCASGLATLRKIISGAVRALWARGCRVDWYVHYNMDRATPRQLHHFLDRVRIGIGQLQG